MKIVLISAANNIHTVRWANGLSSYGHEIHVISCPDHQEGKNKFIECITIHYMRYNSGIGYYLNAKFLRKILREINADVVNVHYASGYGTLARVAKVKNYLLNVWGSDVYSFPRQNFINKIILKKNLKFAPYIASTSNCMAREMEKYVKKNFYITPFGVDTNMIYKIKKDNKDKSKIHLGTIKTLEYMYGIDVLINAVFILKNKLKEKGNTIGITYDIYGKGNEKDNLYELIKSKGLQNEVFLKGYIENTKINAVLNEFDIFILGSREESFGVSAIEAMAAGVPVVATKTEGFSEVIEDGISGILVDINDSEALANAIYDLMTDKEKYNLISNNSIERVSDNYSWKYSLENMISIYQKISRR